MISSVFRSVGVLEKKESGVSFMRGCHSSVVAARFPTLMCPAPSVHKIFKRQPEYIGFTWQSNCKNVNEKYLNMKDRDFVRFYQTNTHIC